ncbi:hypothetical protein BDV98DRAFT_573254 [Pterulicium gracile]|uniref:DUF7918 domain-containing protein n=1 Tax=Pterulicium gracile TaxID=1884261 RepID=A0A5C3Q7Z6_9AGAR|nr:hypothetical protein BDV98DRAFT_573254 [Pterula gracilis]
MSIPIIDNFSAWINVDGHRVDAYQIVSSGTEPQTITCWIPSQAGKEFSVHWADDERRYTSTGRILIDGQRAGGRTIDGKNEKPRAKKEQSRGYITMSTTTKRPYVFSQLMLADSDAPNLDSHPEKIGSIVLNIYRSKYRPHREPRQFHTAWSADLPVDERAKKASVHRAACGEPTSFKRPRKTMGRHLDLHARVATFMFKYTSLEVLRAQGIAPPSVHPRQTSNSTSTVKPEPGLPPLDSSDVLDLTQDFDVKKEFEGPIVVPTGWHRSVIDLTLD